MFSLFANTAARTDDDIGDDAAGKARAKAAAASKARKASQAQQLASSNSALAKRVGKAGPTVPKAKASTEAKRWSLFG